MSDSADVIDCAYRSDVRPGEPLELATCARALELPNVGRPCTVNVQMCLACQAGRWADVSASLALSFAKLGRAPDEPAPATLEAAIPPPAVRVAPSSPVRWAVGVRTCPRPGGTNYLPQTLDALAAAGWRDVMVFAEPGSQVPRGVPATRRAKGLGGWGSWYASAVELLLAEPEAGAYLLVEDDARIAPGARSHLEEHVLWPDGSAEQCLSLYTSGPHERDAGGKPGWHARAKWTLGSVAVVMSQAFLRRMLVDPAIANHRWAQHAPTRNTDGQIGQAAAHMGRPVWHPVPSLAWHMGHDSATWPGLAAEDHRQASSFAGWHVQPKPRPPVRVGFVAPVWHVGGMERWTISLTRLFDRSKAEPAGIAVLSNSIDPQLRAETERYCPVLRSVAELAARSDVLVVSCTSRWGDYKPPGWDGPTVLVAHGSDGWTRGVMRDSGKHCSHAAAVSTAAARVVAGACEVIPNGIDVGRCEPTAPRAELRQRFGLPAEGPVLAHVGRFQRQKNLSATLAALAELPEWTLLLVGQGPDAGRYLAEASRLGVADRCVWRNPIEQVGDAFGAADCFAFPAIPEEGFGLAMVEAWAAGLPTVSTPAGIVPEAEERHGPLVVRIGFGATPAEFAAAVRAAIDPANAATVERARQVAREFYPAERMAAAWSDYLWNVGRTSAPRRPMDFRSARLAACAGCDKWQNNACRCPKQADRVDPTTIHQIDLTCPLRKWPVPSATVAA